MNATNTSLLLYTSSHLGFVGLLHIYWGRNRVFIDIHFL